MVLELFCNICYEPFAATHDIRSTPCGHVSHRHCVSNWLARSSTCPDCRQPCAKSNLLKIFIKSRIAFSDNNQGANSKLMIQLEQTVKKLSETQRLLKESEKKFAGLANKIDGITREIAVLSQQKNEEYEGNSAAPRRTAPILRRQSDGGIYNKPCLDLQTTDIYQYTKKLRQLGYEETICHGAPMYARRNSFHSIA